MRRKIWSGIAAVCAVTALTACGSSDSRGIGDVAGSSAAPTATTPTATTPTAASSAPATAASTTSAAGSASISIPAESTSSRPATPRSTGSSTHVPVQRASACKGDAIRVTLNRGAAQDDGNANYRLHFTNVGRPACTLTGFPGVDAVTSSGKRVTSAHQNPGGTGGIKAIFLVRGAHADALLQWSTTVDNGQAQCPSTAPNLKITPPNTFATAQHHAPIGLCGLAIHPVYLAS